MNTAVVANTILYCRNWQETQAFYRNTLQFPVLSERDWFIEFELNAGARLSIADEARASIKSAEGRGLTLSLRVNDLHRRHRQYARDGPSPTALKPLWGSEVFYLHDPEGNRLEFWQ